MLRRLSCPNMFGRNWANYSLATVQNPLWMSDTIKALTAVLAYRSNSSARSIAMSRSQPFRAPPSWHAPPRNLAAALLLQPTSPPCAPRCLRQYRGEYPLLLPRSARSHIPAWHTYRQRPCPCRGLHRRDLCPSHPPPPAPSKQAIPRRMRRGPRMLAGGNRTSNVP